MWESGHRSTSARSMGAGMLVEAGTTRRSAQRAAQELPRRGAGKRGDELEPLRDLVTRQGLGAVAAQLVRSCRGAIPQYDQRREGLLPLGVGPSHGGRVDYVRMAQQH